MADRPTLLIPTPSHLKVLGDTHLQSQLKSVGQVLYKTTCPPVGESPCILGTPIHSFRPGDEVWVKDWKHTHPSNVDWPTHNNTYNLYHPQSFWPHTTDPPLMSKKDQSGTDLLDFTSITIKPPKSYSQKGPPKYWTQNWGIQHGVILSSWHP